jgi:hypothetical protein
MPAREGGLALYLPSIAKYLQKFRSAVFASYFKAIPKSFYAWNSALGDLPVEQN